MARKRKELPILEDITITDVAAEGNAVARTADDTYIRRKKEHNLRSL